MHFRAWRRVFWLLIAVVVFAPPVASFAFQTPPDVLRGVDALRSIPAPQSVEIRPRQLAAYGALVAAATLGILYLYRGRAFVVYWILSWTLLAGSFTLNARGYEDVRLGSVMIGMAQLLAVWSAGLLLISVDAFSEDSHRWNVPVQASAVAAMWFLAAPFVLPLSAVVYTGPAATAVLHGWASVRYARLTKRTPIIGAFMISVALATMGALDATGALMTFGPEAASYSNSLLVLNIVTCIFTALGMHLLVFEDMTAEIGRTNQALAAANEQVKTLAITDPLTGCHNRRFLEEIVDRREANRHQRYDRPLSVVFVDLNRFKLLNDTYGHDTGDAVLRTLGEVLRTQVRESDYVIRWGGDEFLLLLTCSADEARVKATELKAAFDAARDQARLPATTGLSIGVAGVPKDVTTLAEAISKADAEMYRDKVAERIYRDRVAGRAEI